MHKQYLMALMVCLFTTILQAGFGQAPAGWGDIRFGLVSNGVPYDAANPLSFDTHRLKVASDSLGIQIAYRYRYVNEGVNPATNACVNLFQWKWDADYSKHAQRDAGVEAAYVIYVLQEEGGRVKMLSNMSSQEKMQQFFHTLRIVAEHANGYGATIVVEPDTWGYFMQERFGTVENPSLEVDPLLIPASINNLQNFTVQDSFYVIPDTTKPWEKEVQSVPKEISFDYLRDLPNNMAGFGRAIVRTLHKYAPDCYVGFLASHWSVNLNLDGNGWNSNGLVWSTPELRDTSAKLNIEFFDKLYFGSIDAEHPWQPGDDPDFIGVEKNGWCAGLWESQGSPVNWMWGDEQMRNYLEWVEQIGRGLDLPVLGWQISIGNPSNPDVADDGNMANAYRDTFFPYFFTHVQEFLDAGFIGFLVGKGLPQATDYTLPGETVGEQGWFLTQLQAFDSGRPYLDTTVTPVQPHFTSLRRDAHAVKVVMIGSEVHLNLENFSSVGTIRLYSLKGQKLRTVHFEGSQSSFSLNGLARGTYLMQVEGVDGITLQRRLRL